MPVTLDEHVLSLVEAAKELPKRRGGRRVHVATLYRWARRGLNGVRLEVLRIGGTVFTSREALQRFFERLTEREGYTVSTTSRRGDDASVDAELDSLGL